VGAVKLQGGRKGDAVMEMRKALERELENVKGRQSSVVREAAELLTGSRTHLAHNLSARAVAIGEFQARIELLEMILRDTRLEA
jgi:hypothetical protein